MNGVENLEKLRDGCFQKDSDLSMTTHVKKVKLDVTVDEVWPVFSLKENPETTAFTIELPEIFYREYLWTMYKYHEMQLKLQVYYEQCQRAELDATECVLRSDVQ